MITLHFTVSNYSEDFIELALCAEDKMLTSQQVTKYAWEKNEDNLQDYWKFKLITEVKKDIEGWEPPIFRVQRDILTEKITLTSLNWCWSYFLI